MSSVEGSRDLLTSSQVDPSDPQGRRMSDPVRPLDRNFGVGGQLSRHRSFGNLGAGAAGGRTPLHNQRVRGQEGFMDPAQLQQQTVNQVNIIIIKTSKNKVLKNVCKMSGTGFILYKGMLEIPLLLTLAW